MRSVFYTTNLKLHRGLKIIGNEVPEYLQMIEKHGYLCIRILDKNPICAEMRINMKTKEQFMTRTVVVWLGALMCCALWGSAFPCIKIGYQLFEIPSGATATQILFAGCRFTLAGILAIIIGSVLGFWCRRKFHGEKSQSCACFRL